MPASLMDPVLVTGGTGFVGSQLVRQLRAEGQRVSCTLRASSNPRWLEGLGVTLVQTDLLGPVEDLARVVSGHQVVYHVAGITRALTYDDFLQVNAEATENLLRACVAAPEPPRRFVLVSSVGATGPATGGQRLSERTPPGERTDYGRSKWEAEQRALPWAQQLELVILRLTAVYGPRDQEMLPLFRMAQRGILPAFAGPGQIFNLIHVEDVARAIVAAGGRPMPSGSVALVGAQDEHSGADLAAMLGRVLGRNVRPVVLPRALLWGAATVSELSARLLRRPAMLNRQKIPELVGSWRLDLSHAESLLGLRSQIPLEEGLTRTLAWYREQGWL